MIHCSFIGILKFLIILAFTANIAQKRYSIFLHQIEINFMLNDSVKKFMINLSNLFHFHSLFEAPTLPRRVGIFA